MYNVPERDIPVLVTGDGVVFPGVTINLVIQSTASVRAVERAQLTQPHWISIVASKRDGAASSSVDDLYRVGVLGQIDSVKPLKAGLLQISFRAIERIKFTHIDNVDGSFVGAGAALIDRLDADPATISSLHENVRTVAGEILQMVSADLEHLLEELRLIPSATDLSYRVAQYLNLPKVEAQDLLEMISVKNRLLRLLELLAVRKERLKVESKIRETLSENLSKKQREALLREQLHAIQEELGEKSEGPTSEDYRGRIDKAEMPQAVREVALREVSRLERMGSQAPESQVIRNYLDLLCDMPWTKSSNGEVNLEHAEAILQRDHHGLTEVKRRILEHLAVMKLRPERRGSILLFVGPPGVGKTSLGKSIAEALNREFMRVSLGGVRDDADIRGHRRTYVGALPGRIIDGIRRAKANDPVFVLDEIDKLARGWGGDPASALLEVLDPEQNAHFHDHYLDVPFDLSKVLFIATANSRETIPGPLLDRMEVIELSGYTNQEKFHIAKQHLIPEELPEHGLSDAQLRITDEGLMKVIEGYTREAGVRSLRRELGRICRWSANRIARNAHEVIDVDPSMLSEILGPIRFQMSELLEGSAAGVATGMAWTPVGGDVLTVEAASIPGEGRVVVTGQLGDVMKESSQIAVALARLRLEGIAKSVVYKDRDIHIHVPSGAIPKDGPSAGVTMFTAVASMMLERPVDARISMTGEVTLRGKILPVGGIKEKVLAAARYGVSRVIMPKQNARDLDEIPADVRDALTFHLVSNIDELLEHVFGTLPPRTELPLARSDVAAGASDGREPHLH